MSFFTILAPSRVKLLPPYLDFMPVYFQACKDASPTGSGVDLFGLALTLSPISIVGGISITVYKCYRPQLWLGWVCTVISMGLLLLLRSDSSRALSIGLSVLAGAGMGTAYTGTFFPVLAPLSVDSNAHAISLGVFLRAFAQVNIVSLFEALRVLIFSRYGASLSVVLFCRTSYNRTCLWSSWIYSRTPMILHTAR